MNELLVAVARRLRLAWAVATADLALPAVLATAAALVLLGRVRPWAWPEPLAAFAVVCAVATIAITAAALRIPALVAARAADRGLGTRDAFATALEVGQQPFAELVLARAGTLAAGRRAADAVPLPWRPRRAVAVAVLAVVALALAVLPNTQDEVRARAAAAEAELETAAATVEEAAAALRADAGPTAEAAAAHLEELAQDLRRAEGLDEGQEAFDRAAAELAAGIDPGFLSQKAASVGLERSLEAAPLSGASGGGVADQLAATADALVGLSEEDKAALAERLAALAATQAAGNPDLASSLRAAAGALASGEVAAGALASGEVAAAAAALAAAAGQQASASASVTAQDAATAAIGAVAMAAGQLGSGEGRAGTGAGEGQGAGQGAGAEQGSGQGQGQGEGQGQGSGEGQGAGQGQGQGSGQGGKGAGSGGSGKVGGSSAPSGSGRGGQGTAAGSGDNASVGLQEGATVFAPEGSGSLGDRLLADTDRTDGRTETVGKGDGTTTRGGRVVPLADAFPAYDARATAALDQLRVPPSVRALVRAYFDGLGGRR